MAIWLAIRDGKRSSYVIGSGVNSGIGFRGKFLIALELPAGRAVVGARAWGASLWMGALGCTGAELEEFPAHTDVYHERSVGA